MAGVDRSRRGDWASNSSFNFDDQSPVASPVAGQVSQQLLILFYSFHCSMVYIYILLTCVHVYAVKCSITFKDVMS